MVCMALAFPRTRRTRHAPRRTNDPASAQRAGWWLAIGLTIVLLSVALMPVPRPGGPAPPRPLAGAGVSPRGARASTGSPVTNFTASVGRLVELVALAGGGILALVWARVALSWFSSDIGKKVQAKDRARDALIGTLVFTAAITGLVWALAQWVLTGA
ncbi:MAG: hypothetical protein QXG65_04680 [Thermoplasmata archaeon]